MPPQVGQDCATPARDPAFDELEASLNQSADRIMGGSVGNQTTMPPDCSPIARSANGPYLWDVRGRRYLDLLCGSGATLLGHAHPDVTAAIVAQAAKGTTYLLLNELAIELAERLTAIIPCAEQIRFASTGSEAVMHALRIARVYTNRPKILKFEGAFHGTNDYALQSAFHPSPAFPRPRADCDGIPEAFNDLVLVCRWNDLEMLECLLERHAEDLAVVIMEAGLQRGIPAAPGFLSGVRDLTRRHDVLLLFDEMVTGFRLALGGAQELYGVVPDLATFGKALTNGMPMAFIAGRGEILDVTHTAQAGGDRTREGDQRALYGGTLNGNPLCAAAALAVLEVLQRPGTYEHLRAIGVHARDGLRAALTAQAVPAQVTGDGPVFQIYFGEDPVVDFASYARSDHKRSAAFTKLCLQNGVLNGLHGKFYMSLAHATADVDAALEIFADALAATSAPSGGLRSGIER